MAPARVILSVAAAILAVAAAHSKKAPVAVATAAPSGASCYEDGERAIGASGYPHVKYMPCCSGKPPLPMAETTSAEYSWGLFCGGTGMVVVTDDCYASGVRAIGASGYAKVPYKPCCDGKEPMPLTGDWGKFFGHKAPVVIPTAPAEEIPIKCAGDSGYPYVPHVPCASGEKCAKAPEYGWGFFCLKVTKNDCYGQGVRAIGASGYPAIDYMPCCDGSKPEATSGECSAPERKRLRLWPLALPPGK